MRKFLRWLWIVFIGGLVGVDVLIAVMLIAFCAGL